MIMRKHFYAISILLGLGILLIWPRGAVAGDIEWQIYWQDDGVIREEIHISGRDFKISDSNWEIIQEGDRYILQRKIDNWQKYGEMTDRLPLQVQQRNCLIYKKTEITTSPWSAGLFQQIKDGDNLIVDISVPGFMIGVSGQRLDSRTAQWKFFNYSEMLAPRGMMTVINTDGLLLSIIIFLLGLFFIIIKFVKQLKKVDRIIAEEYSLTKVRPESRKEDE